MEVNQAIREKNIRHAFRYFDQSGTGEITMADLVRVMGSEQHAREVVGECMCSGMQLSRCITFAQRELTKCCLVTGLYVLCVTRQWTSTVTARLAMKSSRP